MQEKKLVINFSVPLAAVYLLAVTFVFEMRSVWTAMPKYSRINDLLLLLLVVATVAYVFSRKQYTGHFLNGIITTAALCAYLYIYYFYDEYKADSFPKMVLRFCAVCLLCFALREEHKQKLFELMEKIIIVIAVVSLAFWLVGSLLGIIQPSGIEYTIWSSTDGSEVPINNYFHLYFETQYQRFFDTIIMRNSAIFTEAPMSSFMFCFAFLVELFKKKQYNVKICVLLLIAIVTCISTTGYVVAIIAIFMKYVISNTGKNTVASVLKLAIAPFVLIVIVLVMEFVFESKLQTTSGSLRMDDFVAGFKAWMLHPIMGNGYGNSNSYVYMMSTFRIDRKGFSNSLMQILAYGGLYLLAPYAGSFGLGAYRYFKKADWNNLVFICLFLIMFIFTITSFQMLPLFVFFSLL